MENKQFNEQRYRRKKNKYRLSLGIQQFIYYPILNLFWGLFVIVYILLVIFEKEFVANMEVHSVFKTIFPLCMKAILIIVPFICAIGLIQAVGYCFAVKDEADLEIIFNDKRDVKNQSPIFIYKKKDRKSGVVKREFYTSISMERWQEKKEAICDRMDIHLIGDITYGGKKKNNGNLICFEAAKGRTPTERGVLYDDTF